MQAVADVRPEDDVRRLIESWLKAVRAKDLDAIVSHYAPDIVAFDAIAQLRFKGRDAYKEHWKACLAMCEGPMSFEIHELTITAGDDLAFGHYLSRCGGTGEDGEEKAGWTRATVGCRRIGGKWMMVHEHFSAPFDVESGKALLGLQP
jgi:uncharacterized protein (TIGR02246 family)